MQIQHQSTPEIKRNSRKQKKEVCAFILTGEIIEIETNYAPQGW